MQARGKPRVRVLHASPDTQPVDIHVDGTPAIVGVAYGEVSPYEELPAGHHTADVYPMTAGAPAEPLLHAGIETHAGEDYTLAVVGRTGHLEPILLLDSTSAPAGERAKVRLFHTSPDAPPLDLAVANRPPLFENVAYKDVTPFQEAAAEVVDLHFRPSGSATPLITLPDYTLGDGYLYTFVALGLLRGTPAFMIMPLVETIEMRLPT